jgi:cobalt-zinc-cadmium efflux system outer membrane protein
MQSLHLVLGAAVLLAQLIPFSTQAAVQQSDAFTIGEVATAANTNSASLTLEQAIAMTLSISPELRSAAHSVEITEGARVQAGVRPNPELALLREGTSSRSNRSDTYQLSLPIELGGKRGARIKLAEQDQVLTRRCECYSCGVACERHCCLFRGSYDARARCTR